MIYVRPCLQIFPQAFWHVYIFCHVHMCSYFQIFNLQYCFPRKFIFALMHIFAYYQVYTHIYLDIDISGIYVWILDLRIFCLWIYLRPALGCKHTMIFWCFWLKIQEPPVFTFLQIKKRKSTAVWRMPWRRSNAMSTICKSILVVIEWFWSAHQKKTQTS